MTTNAEDNTATPSTTETQATSVEKLVAEQVAAALAPIKANLDNAYAARDAANAKLAQIELERKAAELKRMEEEGKHKEIAEMRLAEAAAKIKALEDTNTNLSRDVAVREAMKAHAFRNAKAADMAYQEIVSHLVKNDQGRWMHTSGVSVSDFVEAFAKDEEQSFLFKPKASSGAGTTTTQSGTTTTSSGKRSLFTMSQAEVLKMASEGKL